MAPLLTKWRARYTHGPPTLSFDSVSFWTTYLCKITSLFLHLLSFICCPLNRKANKEEKKQGQTLRTLDKARIKGSLSCILPAVSTNTTSMRCSLAEERTDINVNQHKRKFHKSQWELKKAKSKLRKARENESEEVKTGFSFVSDCLMGWRLFFFDQSQYTVKPDQRHFGDTTQHIRCVLLLLTNRWGPLLRSNKRLWFIILRMSYACRAYRVRRGDGSFDTLIITSITTTCQTTVSYSNYIKKTFPNLFHNKIKTMLKNLLCERLQLLSQAYQNWWRPWQ